jgi:iron complex outermembrane recepter protein
MRNPKILAVMLASACSVPGLANTVVSAYAADSEAVRELGRLSLAELANVEVTSVTKSAQSLAGAPAAIYVITREELLRSGVRSIPEALRLAPNMQVSRLTSSNYSIGARGLGGAPDVQSFSNKILILIDGRSVYSPLFSGVFYETLDVLMDDVERIEVISGPGATLWGANAMNGVINIITRSSRDSQGGLVRAGSGTQENAASARYGGSIGPGGAWRVYATGFDRGASEFDGGASAHDRWNKVQGGFRADVGGDRHQFTVQGDWQKVSQKFAGVADVDIEGANLLGRWTHTGARVETRAQFYYDHDDRGAPPEGASAKLDTLDFEVQQSASLGGRHKLIWGVGHRMHDYTVGNTATLRFEPPHRKINLTNVFIQDSIALSDAWCFIAGIKFEDSTFMDFEPLPELRLAWTPSAKHMVWLAGARAIRSPTPFDVDVEEWAGSLLFLEGDPDFRAETVDAYEIGWRASPLERLSFTAAAFYDVYDDLRTIEVAAGGGFLPLRWGNLMEGSAYGVEIWGHWQATSWWRLSPGFRSLRKRLRFSDGSAQLLGVAIAGNDPRSQASLKSSMDFGAFTLDAHLRHVGDLPAPVTDSYEELDARVAWQVSPEFEVSVTGVNLLHERHREYAFDEGRNFSRAVFGEVRWNF